MNCEWPTYCEWPVYCEWPMYCEWPVYCVSDYSTVANVAGT